MLDRLDVPEAQSWASTIAVDSPRVTASRAIPAPVTPPPITRTSSSASALVLAASADSACWRDSAVSLLEVIRWPSLVVELVHLRQEVQEEYLL
ncbi:hypothetical protein NKG05_06640 [Oerskovia sp. M15]